MKKICIQKIGALLSPMISTFITTGLTYGLMSNIFIYLEDHYVALINPGSLVSTCVYIAIFIPLFYIIDPIINVLFGNKYAESKVSNNSPDKNTAPLTHDDYTIAAIISRLKKENG